MEGLIDALLQANIERVNSVQTALRTKLEAESQAPTLNQLMQVFIRPIWAPAAFNPEARSAIIIQEIYRHASTPLRRRADALMQASSDLLVGMIAARLPKLDGDALQRRFCTVIGASMSMLPRAPAWELYRARHGGSLKGAEEAVLEDLIRMAVAALKA